MPGRMFPREMPRHTLGDARLIAVAFFFVVGGILAIFTDRTFSIWTAGPLAERATVDGLGRFFQL
jgi:hypothetical protein